MNHSDYLRDAAIFSALTDQELSYLSEHARIRQYDIGERIEDEHEKGLYLIKKGRVRAFVTDMGKEKSLYLIEAGEIFGETRLFTDEASEDCFRASGKTEIVFFSQEAISDIFHRNAAAKKVIMQSAAIKAIGGFVCRVFDIHIMSYAVEKLR